MLFKEPTPKGFRLFITKASKFFQSFKTMRKLFGFCPNCRKWFKYPKRRRMNTAYVEDEYNFSYECKECYDKTIEYFEDMWADYYSGRY